MINKFLDKYGKKAAMVVADLSAKGFEVEGIEPFFSYIKEGGSLPLNNNNLYFVETMDVIFARPYQTGTPMRNVYFKDEFQEDRLLYNGIDVPQPVSTYHNFYMSELDPTSGQNTANTFIDLNISGFKIKVRTLDVIKKVPVSNTLSLSENKDLGLFLNLDEVPNNDKIAVTKKYLLDPKAGGEIITAGIERNGVIVQSCVLRFINESTMQHLFILDGVESIVTTHTISKGDTITIQENFKPVFNGANIDVNYNISQFSINGGTTSSGGSVNFVIIGDDDLGFRGVGVVGRSIELTGMKEGSGKTYLQYLKIVSPNGVLDFEGTPVQTEPNKGFIQDQSEGDYLFFTKIPNNILYTDPLPVLSEI